MLGGFLISLVASVGSYFKALSDIRQEIQMAIFMQADKLREEVRSRYTSKEETQFIQQSLMRIEGNIKDVELQLRELKQTVTPKGK